MSKLKTIFVLMVFCFLAHASWANWETAGRYFQEERFAEAVEETDRVLQANPDDLVVLRIKAMALLELEKYTAAETTLRHAVQLDPEHVPSRYYLAQVLAYNGSYEESIQHLETVVEKGPSTAYADKARSVLGELKDLLVSGADYGQAKTPWWGLTLKLSAEMDDNVPARSDKDKKEDPDTEALRLSAFLNLELSPFSQQRGDWVTLQPSYSLYVSQHEGSRFDAYDVLSHNGQVTVGRAVTVAGVPVNLELSGGASLTDLDSETFSEQTHFRADVIVQWADQAVLAISSSWDDKDFEDDTEFPDYWSRDGLETTYRVDQYVYLMDNDLILGVAYTRKDTDADGKQFVMESDGYEGLVMLNLPAGFRFMTRVIYEEESYVNFVPDPERLDDILTTQFVLSKELIPDRLTGELNWSRVDSDSTQDFSQYERNSYGFSLSATF